MNLVAGIFMIRRGKKHETTPLSHFIVFFIDASPKLNIKIGLNNFFFDQFRNETHIKIVYFYYNVYKVLSRIFILET